MKKHMPAHLQDLLQPQGGGGKKRNRKRNRRRRDTFVTG